MVKAKRIYEPPAPDDGLRVLVMRLWPRGIRKQAIDLWLKELGASVDSLRAWKAGGIDWPEMEKRYVAGLTAPAAAAQLADLAALAHRETVTVLCSCVDESQCHRGILKAVLAAARPVIGRKSPRQRLTRPGARPYTRRVAGKYAAACVFLLVLLAAGKAPGEHETYYRYTVLGYVKDASGKQGAGISVELLREKTGFSYLAETDSAGLYVIVARLGDESVGERLRLRAGIQTVTVLAQFDPNDHTRERGTRVDFDGRKPVETPSAFAATLKRFLDK